MMPGPSVSFNLAALLYEQGELDVARPLFERALATRERVLGPAHPDTVATRCPTAEDRANALDLLPVDR